jgi:aldose 1-epimerase
MAFETVITEDSGLQVVVLRDKITGCEAEIYAFGGLLNAFRIPGKDQKTNVIDGFASVQDAKENITNGFKSTKLSPFVCRMNKGHYRFEGKDLTIQKFFLAGHAIHGLLFDAVFEVTGTEANDQMAAITLTHHYKAEDAGYPFTYNMVIHWKLEAGNKLTTTTSISHNSQKSIPLADGWHPYFALGGSVDEWVLQFDSDCQLEYNDELLPTGNKFTDNRFTNGTSLRGIELDNSFELASALSEPKCVLQNKSLKLTIQPDKNYPILQVYIPPHRKSIAIENLSGAPDNFNNGLGLILLAPGESKTFTTSYGVENIEY